MAYNHCDRNQVSPIEREPIVVYQDVCECECIPVIQPIEVVRRVHRVPIYRPVCVFREGQQNQTGVQFPNETQEGVFSKKIRRKHKTKKSKKR